MGVIINLPTPWRPEYTSSNRSAYISWTNACSGSWVKVNGTTKGFSTIVKEYEYRWKYDVIDSTQTITTEWTKTSRSREYANYTVPDNAENIKFQFRVIPNTYTGQKATTKNGRRTYTTVTKNYFETAYSDWTSKVSAVTWSYPSDPSAPVATIDTATNVITTYLEVGTVANTNTTKIQFMLYRNGEYTGKSVTSSLVSTATNIRRATATFSVSASDDGYYQVRCRAGQNGLSHVHEWSENWSDLSDTNLFTGPTTPTGLTAKGMSETSAFLEWDSNGADSYVIGYTTKVQYFDGGGGDVTYVETGSGNSYEITGLEGGQLYYFRIKAKQNGVESPWSFVPASTVVGKIPAPPTTWAYDTTITSGENPVLNWVHNSQDNSTETWFWVNLLYDGSRSYDIIQTDSRAEEYKNNPYRLTVGYNDQPSSWSTLEWKVRTKGILGSSSGTQASDGWSDWSTVRTIKKYETPEVIISQPSDVITNLNWIDIQATATPANQNVVGFNVIIQATDEYSVTDVYGNDKVVAQNEVLFEKWVAPGTGAIGISDHQFALLLDIDDVVLTNLQTYNLTVEVAMDSGLNASSTIEMYVELDDPGAEWGVDGYLTYDEGLKCMYIEPVAETEDDTYPGIDLYVYRVGYDGKYVKLTETPIDSSTGMYVVDPHPALDYGRYRVVGIDPTTGITVGVDLSPYEIHETSIIIQWDEVWGNFYMINIESEDDLLTSSVYQSGMMLELPYNIDVSNNYSPDDNLVKYIGRSNPVGYYGTQLGETQSWSAAIEMTDTDTLNMLRLLAEYRGDVYVREPNGSGFWANVNVSFNRNHCETVMPISIEVTRVEGGV